MPSKLHQSDKLREAAAQTSPASDQVTRSEPQSQSAGTTLKPKKHWLRRHWSTFGAAFVLGYLALNLSPFTGSLGPLNRYIISDQIEWDPNHYGTGPGTEYRSLTLRGVTQDQLMKALSERFSTDRGWNKPYIETGGSFVFKTHKGPPGQEQITQDHVVACGHYSITPQTDVTIHIRRPLSPLQNGYASMREFWRDIWGPVHRY